MRLARGLLDELIAHAHEDAPNECCGVVAVDLNDPMDGTAEATEVHREVNTAASPMRFEVDGRQLLRTSDEIEAQGGRIGAIYHSHTRTAPYPSQTDINFAAYWPGVEWLIIGVANGDAEVRSYLIDGADVCEVPVEVTGS